MEHQRKPTHDNEPTHKTPSHTSDGPTSSTHNRQPPSRDVRTPTKDVDIDHAESNQPESEPESPEPSLRFPRPVGNTHLANWISTSDPDIMRITSESVSEEGGLADSTYELLTHADDTASENESQYENNDESFSESVSSLDQRRPDDVHSVSEDDEDDIPMLVQAPLPVTERYERPVTPIQPATVEEYESEEESDTNSRSSLEYTHEKLGTPSMGLDETPKASAFFNRTKDQYQQERTRDQFLLTAIVHAWEITRDGFKEWYAQTKNDWRAFEAAYQRRPPGSVAWGFYQCFIVFFASFMFAAVLPLLSERLSPYLRASAATTSLATPAPQSLATTTTSSTPRASTTGTRTDLNVREEPSALDWIFYRDLGLSYSTVDNTFVVDIPPHIKQEWLSKDCVNVTATREGKEIDTPVQVKEVKKGIAATLPRRERYGDIDFFVKTTCAPHIKQHVTVNFGPYENEFAALARQTKDLARWYAEDKRDQWATIYDFIIVSGRRDIVPACEKAVNVVSARLTSARQVVRQTIPKVLDWSKLKRDVADSVDLVQRRTEVMIRDVQTGLKLGLLNNQINAKLWWLKITRQDAEREIYSKKASVFMAEKVEKASNSRRNVKQYPDRLWNIFFDDKPECPRAGECKN